MRKTVAIVGRPNVGKSALFNRLAGKNIAIVHDQPGVTRDRIMAECRRASEVFDIMDTGGIGENTSDVLTEQVQVEAAIALDVADLMLFVVDVVTGITPVDAALAKQLRQVSKPVVLVCNKADSPKRRMGSAEFSKLGFHDQIEVSAEHNLGIVDLVNRISDHLGFPKLPPGNKKKPVAKAHDEAEAEEDYSDPKYPKKPTYEDRKAAKIDFLKSLPMKLAIIGRPNAGKSSLVNALLNENRAIVSPLAGTTRDALDIECEFGGKTFHLIDTAGIRRQSKVDTMIEVFSVKRAVQSIERCDLCLFVIDCADGITAQDRKIANLILDAHKPCVLVLNKWDLFMTDEPIKKRQDKLKELVRRELFFLHYAPTVTISAKNRQGLDRLFQTIERVRLGSLRRVGTGPLNRLLTHAIENSPGPIGTRADSFKLLYATQVNNAEDRAVPVPHFVLFANRAYKLQDSYLRYLESKIREVFPGEGLPFYLKIKAKAPEKKRGGE